jgi:hypothetical protein
MTRCFITHHVPTHLLIFAQPLINEVVDNIRNAGTASGTGNFETGMLILSTDPPRAFLRDVCPCQWCASRSTHSPVLSLSLEPKEALRPQIGAD